MKTYITPCLIVVTIIALYLPVKAQTSVRVHEVTRTMPTYAFSDPNPIANIGRIYPYYRFDGYASQAADKEWKFIELENDYIKVFITPEIGGKIWGAIEKSTGKEFIYYNHAVKFRDVAMRGPWTSGGIESNFGAIGHAPTCSTPVDYMIRKNEDGSVSCFIGALDLPSRTAWRIEINLQPDKSYFTTKALWHNPTPTEQSYYQWMNAGVKTAGNLEYAYPGSNYIGHDGSLHDWPIHPEGKDISWYGNNNFGGYKSYHVLGELTNFFGGYWHDDKFGFGHYADYAGKPGKKLWIWGLSRQGMIWENLLTDTDGQYTEIQSGRLFNQEAGESIKTPFKHRGFAPYATDTWTEYWFPVMTTEGVVQATPKASLNLEQEDGSLHIWLSANEIIADSLVIELDGKTLAEFEISLSPTEVVHKTIPFTGAKEEVSVKIGTEYIIIPGGTAGQKLSRPLATVDFNWQSVQGLAMQARGYAQERNYGKALDFYYQCLEQDNNYLPALAGVAGLLYRNNDYNKALAYATRALAIDTYYPAANFIYGAINEQTGHITDAIDGYAIASVAVEYRSAAFLGLARIYFKQGDYAKSGNYAEKSLEFNANNLSATELLLLSRRKLKNYQSFNTIISTILQKDPLNHFARFERYLMSGAANDLEQFIRLIRNELPHETYLELAIKYYNLGLNREATTALAAAPEHPVVSYWLAYLAKDSDAQLSDSHLKKANTIDPALVFPFRQETLPVLVWAAKSAKSWKPDYYQALIWWNLGNENKAKELFLMPGNEPNFNPFYLTKAQLFEDDGKIVLASLQKAYQLSPGSWRTTLALADNYLTRNEIGQAIKIIKPGFKKDPANYYLGLNYAKALLLSGQNGACLDLLQNLTVLPNEGATEGHHLYRISSLNLAQEALQTGEYDLVPIHLNIARSWPENLGVGKPYITDESLEDYIQALGYGNSGKQKKSNQILVGLINNREVDTTQPFTTESLIVVAANVRLGKTEQAKKIINAWQGSFPDDVFIDWSAKWLNGTTKPPTSPDNLSSNGKIGSRTYYLHWLAEFLIDNPVKK